LKVHGPAADDIGAGFGNEGDGIGWPGCGTVEAVQAAKRYVRRCQLPVLRRIVVALYDSWLFRKASNL